MKTLRGRVRLISYLSALFAVLLIFTLTYWYKSVVYRQHAENGYQRAFSELAASMDGIDISLKKGQLVTSPAMVSSLCTDIFGKAQAATMSLGMLPFSDLELEKTSGFIARLGDYAYSLSRKAASGELLSEEDMKYLAALSETADGLCSELDALQAEIYTNGLALDSAENAQEGLSAGEDSEVSVDVGGSVQLIENEFPEIPSLIYDGPFSEHVEKREALLIADKAEVSESEAKARLAEFFGADESEITSAGVTEGRVKAYSFTGPFRDGSFFAQVTARGGEVLSLFTSSGSGKAVISDEAATAAAESFLKSKGLTSMVKTYTQKSGGAITVNFAYSQEGAICYPDLIKVSVALDDGKICGYEARGYIMSHRERDIPSAEISQAEAEKKVSSNLSVLSHELCVIPTSGKNELYCHEFKCETQSGNHVLLYVNAVTGNEEKLLMLIEDENGTLTI